MGERVHGREFGRDHRIGGAWDGVERQQQVEQLRGLIVQDSDGHVERLVR